MMMALVAFEDEDVQILQRARTIYIFARYLLLSFDFSSSFDRERDDI